MKKKNCADTKGKGVVSAACGLMRSLAGFNQNITVVVQFGCNISVVSSVSVKLCRNEEKERCCVSSLCSLIRSLDVVPTTGHQIKVLYSALTFNQHIPALTTYVAFLVSVKEIVQT